MKAKGIRQWVWVVMLGVAMGLVTGCNDKADEPEPADENELITTVNLKFTESGTTTVQTFSYRDPDGDGGQAPTKFDRIVLKANKTYDLAVELLDESKTPTDDVSKEVAEKSGEHLFVFTLTPASLATYSYGDKDAKNLPIGLKGTVKTNAAGTGKLKVQLRHQPNAKDGTPAPGSDDVNVDFDLTVQ
ncbi:hypothetical protein GCM10028803_15340 [Larkinella knui]|uniref:Type 1 periplasmic binding fold superfamily protein n=1 Tax=Larkinella knui TaxID=2025310 RepID=A0A3P1C9C5_9BACT|nr:hypothetical protein [Larkinella knui]RRB09905.1 hypothetical protein EHT87_30770 [Larkinella knui]